METQQTIMLLQECDAGIKMAVASIDEVIDEVKDANLRELLISNKNHHEKLKEEVEDLIKQYYAQEKEPNTIAKGMSWIKTNMKLTMDKSDATIAQLIIDGCHMGIKSLSKYLNENTNANGHSRKICENLINLEDRLAIDLREYL